MALLHTHTGLNATWQQREGVNLQYLWMSCKVTRCWAEAVESWDCYIQHTDMDGRRDDGMADMRNRRRRGCWTLLMCENEGQLSRGHQWHSAPITISISVLWAYKATEQGPAYTRNRNVLVFLAYLRCNQRRALQRRSMFVQNKRQYSKLQGTIFYLQQLWWQELIKATVFANSKRTQRGKSGK